MSARVRAADAVAVACAADAGYVMPLAAMLHSAVAHLAPSRRLDVHVLAEGIGAADRDRLARACARDGVRLGWIDADPAALRDLPTWGRMPRTTYQRLLLPDLLPDLAKVIWLDCDIVVAADLGRLWDVDLDGRAALAVQDMVVPVVSSRLGIRSFRALGLPAEAKYFNAGVMVLDLDRWRREDVAGRAVAYLRAHHDEVLLWDQEGLNAALHGRWGELDPRWNQNAGVAGRPFFRRPSHLDEGTYRSVVEDPWIVHYCGSLKPWTLHDTGDPARARFFRHLDATAWAGWRPSRTVKRRMAAAYESSRARRLLHPAEGWALRAVARRRRWEAG